MSGTSITASIGSAVAREFYPAQPVSLMYARKPGIPTDDTAMTLALVDALTGAEVPTARTIQDAFGSALRQPTGRYGDMFWQGGPGGACVAMLRAYDDGAQPFERIAADAGGVMARQCTRIRAARCAHGPLSRRSRRRRLIVHDGVRA